MDDDGAAYTAGIRRTGDAAMASGENAALSTVAANARATATCIEPGDARATATGSVPGDAKYTARGTGRGKATATSRTSGPAGAIVDFDGSRVDIEDIRLCAASPRLTSSANSQVPGSLAVDWNDPRTREIERQISFEIGTKIRNRGPPAPKDGGPQEWGGQRWRPGAERWGNSGGWRRRVFRSTGEWPYGKKPDNYDPQHYPIPRDDEHTDGNS
jgi:hypothetical protein